MADADSKFYHYTSLASFASACQARGHGYYSPCRDKWAGGTRDEATRFCRNGDLSKVAAAESLVEKLDAEIDAEGFWPVWQPAVVGSFPLVPAYIAGTPESMLARTDVPDPRGGVEIWANTTVSASCSAADMMRRGVVTLAFAMALSRVRNVSIVLYSTCDGSNVAIRMSSPLDFSEVCAAFCQPSITRHLIYGHAVPDGYSGCWSCWAETQRGADAERKALEKYAGMPPDALRLGTEKLGEYSSVTDDRLVEILNEKVRAYAGQQ